jgi:hypothetical protein
MKILQHPSHVPEKKNKPYSFINILFARPRAKQKKIKIEPTENLEIIVIQKSGTGMGLIEGTKSSYFST